MVEQAFPPLSARLAPRTDRLAPRTERRAYSPPIGMDPTMRQRAAEGLRASTLNHTMLGAVAGSVLISLVVTGCAAQPKRYVVRGWGSMREALGEGRTEGRVGLAGFNGTDGTIAVGALEGLSGEVLVVSGDVWLSRVDDRGEAATTRGASSDDRATMLTMARVPRWRAIPIDEDVPPSSAEKFLIDSARDAGFDLRDPVPFRVEGTLLDLEVHVVAGACPLAASHGRAEPALRPPYRMSSARPAGKVVGFLAEGHEGTLTHHGSSMHAHALLDGIPPVMGHVDRVGFAGGGVLYLPDR